MMSWIYLKHFLTDIQKVRWELAQKLCPFTWMIYSLNDIETMVCSNWPIRVFYAPNIMSHCNVWITLSLLYDFPAFSNRLNEITDNRLNETIVLLLENSILFSIHRPIVGLEFEYCPIDNNRILIKSTDWLLFGTTARGELVNGRITLMWQCHKPIKSPDLNLAVLIAIQ